MEQDFIDFLKRRLPPHRRLLLGLGDDAALLAPPETAGLGVFCTDTLMDGVDFHVNWHDPAKIGRKSLAVNLSDIAAMAAAPRAAVISLVLPKQGGLTLAEKLYEGILPLAEQYDVAIAGGDTNSWDGPLVISVAVWGETLGLSALTRHLAQPGDRILVTGTLGGSILSHHFEFEPRVREAQTLFGKYRLHAGIDISDGLALDLSRICAASNCGAIVRRDAVPISADAHALAASGSGKTPLEHAFFDGEDFELILTAPPEEAARMLAEQPLAIPITEIGHIVAEPGLWQIDSAGEKRPLVPGGFQHALEP